ncbi:MAG: hypothetical protein JST16_00955, partial [Bdellovibrionales bacterium]|nr:hypothetical protein [Bdellovibrionales bacterium]
MALLSKAHQAARAVKNVGRLREIVSAMSRFGFGTLVERTGLKRFSPASEAELEDGASAKQPFPIRLRML